MSVAIFERVVSLVYLIEFVQEAGVRAFRRRYILGDSERYSTQLPCQLFALSSCSE